jgi:hypothetical protein
VRIQRRISRRIGRPFTSCFPAPIEIGAQPDQYDISVNG